MPNFDPYLRPGLPGPNDVELYESAAENQGPTTPVAVAATATGAASVGLVVVHGRQFAVSAAGVATVQRLGILSRSALAVAVGSPTAERAATFARSHTATATGVASLTADFIPAGTDHTVAVATTATGVASESHVLNPPPTEPPPTSGGDPRRTFHRIPTGRRPLTHHVHVSATCTVRVAVYLSVDHAGRLRRLREEDELLLVGAI